MEPVILYMCINTGFLPGGTTLIRNVKKEEKLQEKMENKKLFYKKKIETDVKR